MEITVSSQGDLKLTERFLTNAAKLDYRAILASAAQDGVRALAAATPRDSNLAANSWSYKITGGRGFVTVTWINTDVEKGFPVAIMLQYGYGTGTGGYVRGRDYINPAMKPIFDSIAQRIEKAVSSA